ncbi:hypothetical protein RDI58_000794 [Solanum bulbocastanum]|uniref:Uncharacterized protein n=1 Tax=Solanum bulbocastanum TaxID=147425 RepID=A0AAN8YPD6_SOLBU
MGNMDDTNMSGMYPQDRSHGVKQRISKAYKQCIMSNTSPIGQSSENIMEVLVNISNQVAEMNGRMGGIEERGDQENGNRGDMI